MNFKNLLLTLIATLIVFSSLKSQCFWANKSGSSSGEVVPTSMAANNGFVYTTGYLEGAIALTIGSETFSLGSSAGAEDIFITKLNSLGQLIWAKRIGGTAWDRAYSITIDNDQNIVIVGSFMNTVDFDPNLSVFNMTSSPNSEIVSGFAMKLDSDGNFINAIKISTNNQGYAGEAICTSVESDMNGNYIIGGFFRNAEEMDIEGNTSDIYFDFNPGSGTSSLNSDNGRNFILKLNASLSFVWVKNFCGAGIVEAQVKPELSVDSNGDVYFLSRFSGTCDFDSGSGVFNLSSAGGDIFLLKLSQNGSFQWAKQLGGNSSTYPDIARDIKVDSNDNVIIVGSFSGIVDFDPGSSILEYTSIGINDGFIWKLNNSGGLIFAKILEGSITGQVEPYGVTVDENSNIYLTGWNNANTDFDPGPETFLISGGNAGAFTAKLNASGNFEWAKRLSGTNSACYGKDVCYTNNGVYTSGTFYGTIDFDPSTNVLNQTSFGDTYAYNHKILDTALPSITANSPTTLCAGGAVTLSSSASSGNTWSTGSTNQTITVSSSGIYTVTVTDNSCPALSNSIEVVVNPSPTIINQPINQVVDVSDNAQFITSSTIPDCIYQWQTDLGLGFQNLSSSGQYTGTTNSTLIISNVTTGNNNQLFRCISSYGFCSDTSNVVVLTVNNTVGIKESPQNSFALFPNPAASEIYLEVDKKLIGEVYSIYDLTGRVIAAGQIVDENTKIELGDLLNGFYLFSIGEKMEHTFKLIKE